MDDHVDGGLVETSVSTLNSGRLAPCANSTSIHWFSSGDTVDIVPKQEKKQEWVEND